MSDSKTPKSTARSSSPINILTVTEPRYRTSRTEYSTKELDKLVSASIPLDQLKKDNYQSIIDAIGPNTNVVLIGEASHGTQEFYQMRADISRRLISEHGFQFVALEADWPDTYRLNRWLQHYPKSKDTTVKEALADYTRFPKWMWRNKVVTEFATWLRNHNEKIEKHKRVGIYGLDIYSMFTSAEAVINYLESVDHAAAEKARQRYATLSQFEEDPHSYAYALETGMVESQQQEVARVLSDLLKKRIEYITSNEVMDGDEYFCSNINAKVVKDAEAYYRKAFSGGALTWNLRDNHMFATLQDLIKYHEDRMTKSPQASSSSGAPTSTSPSSSISGSKSEAGGGGQENKNVRCIIWAHNTHIHDARASEMWQRNELNIGQLVRQKLGVDSSFSIGFSTFHGTVSAANKWGGVRQTMNVTPALPSSYEHLLHHATKHAKSHTRGLGMLMRSNSSSAVVDGELIELLMASRLQRAIGVQYLPHRERTAHYHYAVLPLQFNYNIHIDHTSALKALDDVSGRADERVLHDTEMEEEETQG